MMMELKVIGGGCDECDRLYVSGQVPSVEKLMELLKR